jgi:hypothetical protein
MSRFFVHIETAKQKKKSKNRVFHSHNKQENSFSHHSQFTFDFWLKMETLQLLALSPQCLNFHITTLSANNTIKKGGEFCSRGCVRRAKIIREKCATYAQWVR